MLNRSLCNININISWWEEAKGYDGKNKIFKVWMVGSSLLPEPKVVDKLFMEYNFHYFLTQIRKLALFIKFKKTITKRNKKSEQHLRLCCVLTFPACCGQAFFPGGASRTVHSSLLLSGEC